MKLPVIYVAMLTLLSGCAGVPKFVKEDIKIAKTSAELAEIGFYVEQPVFWAGIAEQYQPNFNVNSASALLGAVAPSVGDYYSSSLSSQAFGLDLSYLGRQINNSSSETRATETEGEASESSLSTETNRSATRSSPSVVDRPETTILKPSELEYTPQQQGQNSYDPSAQYRAATALYQRIQNLNNYLRVSYDTKTHVAFLMRAKLAVSPRTRGQPFDLTSSISFQNAGETVVSEIQSSLVHSEGSKEVEVLAEELAKNKANKRASEQLIKKAIETGMLDVETKVVGSSQIKLSSNIETLSLQESNGLDYQIFPLLIGDNIERVNTSQIQNAINAVNLGLGLGSGSTAARVAYERAIERLEALVGSQVNSLLTLSQTSRRDLVIKVSAGFDPEHKYSMRQRTYDVSFVVAMPRNLLKEEEGLETLIRVDNEFTNTKTGKTLPDIDTGTLSGLAKVYNSVATESKDSAESCSKVDGIKEAKNDINRFIYQPDAKLKCWLERDFYLKLKNIRDRSAFKSYRLTFPGIDDSPPESQAVIYTDNESSLSTRLAMTPDKDMSFARFSLKVEKKDDADKSCLDELSTSSVFEFPHRSFSLNGRILNVVFPSLRAVGCDLDNLNLALNVSLDSAREKSSDDYVLLLDKESSDIPPRSTQFELAKFTGTFISGTSDSDGANARIIIEPSGERFPTDYSKFRLSVVGAVLSRVALVGGDAPSGYSFNAARNQVEFDPNATATAYDVVLIGKDAPENEITISVSALDSDDEVLLNQTRQESFNKKNENNAGDEARK